jgi:hypothetical protein
MSKVIVVELHLDSVFRQSVSACHHASVVDQNVQLWLELMKLSRKPKDGVERSQIQL